MKGGRWRGGGGGGQGVDKIARLIHGTETTAVKPVLNGHPRDPR